MNSTYRGKVDKQRRDAFKREIESVCKKHGLSISHEDDHGVFLIKEYQEDLMEWFLGADYDYLTVLTADINQKEAEDK